MTHDLDDLADALLTAARRAGADAADAMVATAASQVIDVRGGALEQAERSEATDLGLRVLVGRRQANVSSSDVRRETLDIIAERAIAMARSAMMSSVSRRTSDDDTFAWRRPTSTRRPRSVASDRSACSSAPPRTSITWLAAVATIASAASAPARRAAVNRASARSSRSWVIKTAFRTGL